MKTLLAAYPKSGSTWLRCLVSAYLDSGHLDINDLHQDVMWGDMPVSLYQGRLGKRGIDITPLDVDAHYREMLDAVPAAYVKTHQPWKEAWHAGVPAVVVIRDPRDIALSLADHLNVTVDEAITCMSSDDFVLKDQVIDQKIGRWDEHVASWSNHAELVVRYEEMEAAFPGVMEFLLGKRPSESLLISALSAASFGKCAAQESQWGFRESSRRQTRFFRQGRPCAWPEVLTNAQRERIEGAFSDTMKAFGYG